MILEAKPLNAYGAFVVEAPWTIAEAPEFVVVRLPLAYEGRVLTDSDATYGIYDLSTGNVMPTWLQLCMGGMGCIRKFPMVDRTRGGEPLVYTRMLVGPECLQWAEIGVTKDVFREPWKPAGAQGFGVAG